MHGRPQWLQGASSESSICVASSAGVNKNVVAARPPSLSEVAGAPPVPRDHDQDHLDEGGANVSGKALKVVDDIGADRELR